MKRVAPVSLDERHDTYLSTSGGMWRLIHLGLPVTANYILKEPHVAAARRFKIDISHGRVWDGDRGEWRDEGSL